METKCYYHDRGKFAEFRRLRKHSEHYTMDIILVNTETNTVYISDWGTPYSHARYIDKGDWLGHDDDRKTWKAIDEQLFNYMVWEIFNGD